MRIKVDLHVCLPDQGISSLPWLLQEHQLCHLAVCFLHFPSFLACGTPPAGLGLTHVMLVYWECAGTVTVFNVAATATPYQLAEQFALYGDVKDVREDPQIQGCWLVEYYDIRHATTAFKSLSRSSSMHATLPVVSETTASQAPQQPLRNVQSSHVLHNEYGSSNQLQADDSWQGPRSWDNKTGAAFQEHLASLMLQRNGEHLHCFCYCNCMTLHAVVCVTPCILISFRSQY